MPLPEAKRDTKTVFITLPREYETYSEKWESFLECGESNQRRWLWNWRSLCWFWAYHSDGKYPPRLYRHGVVDLFTMGEGGFRVFRDIVKKTAAKYPHVSQLQCWAEMVDRIKPPFPEFNETEKEKE